MERRKMKGNIWEHQIGVKPNQGKNPGTKGRVIETEMLGKIPQFRGKVLKIYNCQAKNL